MSKQPPKQVTKKEMIYAINLCITHLEEIDKRIVMLSSLIHNYIEANDDVDKLKSYLENKKVKQEQQNKKETKDAN